MPGVHITVLTSAAQLGWIDPDHPINTAPLMITATGVFVVEGILQFIRVATQLTCCLATAPQRRGVKYTASRAAVHYQTTSKALISQGSRPSQPGASGLCTQAADVSRVHEEDVWPYSIPHGRQRAMV